VSVSPPNKEQNFSGVAKKSNQWSAGLFATFLQVVTLGGEFSVSSSTLIEVTYSCESVETKKFTPSLKYITKAAEDEGVKEYLEIGGLGAKVFMVTGIKIASIITLTATEEEERETNVKIGVDAPMIQGSVGPKGSHKVVAYRQSTRSIQGPIVFAFQVEKFRVGRRGKVSYKQYVDGAMLSVHKGDVNSLIIERAGTELRADEVEDYELEVRAGVEEETGNTCEIVTAMKF
jgi:hypothetical protein